MVIGFDVESFTGPGDGTATELEDLLNGAIETHFKVEKIWLTVKLYKSFAAAILTPGPGLNSHLSFPELGIDKGLNTSGGITWSYRHSGKTIPVFIHPWQREGCVVFEGEHDRK